MSILRENSTLRMAILPARSVLRALAGVSVAALTLNAVAIVGTATVLNRSFEEFATVGAAIGALGAILATSGALFWAERSRNEHRLHEHYLRSLRSCEVEHIKELQAALLLVDREIKIKSEEISEMRKALLVKQLELLNQVHELGEQMEVLQKEDSAVAKSAASR